MDFVSIIDSLLRLRNGTVLHTTEEYRRRVRNNSLCIEEVVAQG
jgi:hypothetical protein